MWKNRSPLYGRKRSPETCEKIRAATIGKKKHPRGEKSLSEMKMEHWAAHPFTDEHRKRLSESHKGLMAGEKHPQWGTHLSPKTKAILSELRRGSRHWNWRGGIGREEYGVEFTEELKDRVRGRDGFLCQDCGVEQLSSGEKLSVHHIDYDRRNNDMTNLISLCRECHGKTNSLAARARAGFVSMEAA